MHRFQLTSDMVNTGECTLGRCMPSPSSMQRQDRIRPVVSMPSLLQTNRNRWSRADLASAIGHDPHELDIAEQVWPPPQPRS